MEILDKLFGSAVKVRLMRLFLLNPLELFSVGDMVNRTMTREKDIKPELAVLEKIALIKRKTIVRKEGTRNKKVVAWIINPNFMYLEELQYFLINARLMTHSDIVKKLQRIGKIKCVIIAGVFLHEWEENRLDLLIVGDDIAKARLDSSIKQLEAEIGRELKYALLETKDFLYRVGMYDKLIREVFDFPHQIILDRIGIKK